MKAMGGSMSALKHIIGFGAVAITLDFWLLNGYATALCSDLLWQGESQILSQLEQLRSAFF
jgi:hypothetical protein